jgi:hypothetical protein
MKVRNTEPLSAADFAKIEEIMDGRDFAIMHWGEDGHAFCNTRDRSGLPHLLECAHSFMKRGKKPTAVGYEPSR